MKREKRMKGMLKRAAAAALAGCMLWCGGVQASAATMKDVFDEHYYADMYPDLKAAFGYNREALWNHFMKYGLTEKRGMSGLIDIVGYREQYADLNAAFGNNWDAYINHYLTYGAQEGRDTGTDFNAMDYAARYSDLKAAFGSNVLALWNHYQTAGAQEEREARSEEVVEAEIAAAEEAEEEQEAQQPAETPKPQETEKPSETPKPQETAKPTETPKPQETAKPSETPKPQETAKPAETPKPEVPGTGYIETPMDLNGRTIRIACSLGSRYNYVKDKDGKDDVANTSPATIEIIEILNQIEKDYNCKFEVTPSVKTGIVKDLQDGKAAGAPIYDIYDAGISDTYLDTIWEQGLIMDLNDPKVKDIIKLDENPWKGGTAAYGVFNGVQYGVEFVTKNSTNDLRNALLFNKDLVAQYELGDLYQLVKDNKWTWEKFEELCEKIKQKDSAMVPAGYGKENLIMPMVVASNGASMAVVGADGKKQYVGNTDEKVVAAYDWVYKLREKGYMAPNWTIKDADGKNVLVEGGVDYDGFTKGKCVFYFDFYGDLQKLTQNSAVTGYHFGLLPCPIGPYGDKCHGVTYSVDLKMIVEGVDKPEEVAAVLVAIANRTTKTSGNIYEEAVMTLDAAEDLDMLKLMYEDMRYDISRSVRKIKTAEPGNNVLQLKKTAAAALEEIAENTNAVFAGEIKNW